MVAITAANIRGSNDARNSAGQPNTNADTVAVPSSPRAKRSVDLTDTNSRQPKHSRGPGKEVRKPRPAAEEEAERNNHNQTRPRRRR